MDDRLRRRHEIILFGIYRKLKKLALDSLYIFNGNDVTNYFGQQQIA